jgi:hypothetical protein
MSDTHINIYGGNNQILPNATQAVQNFYGSEFASKEKEEPLPPEVQPLLLYINKENLADYLARIGECQTATELAAVVLDMVGKESRLTSDLIVKERFISLLLPFADKITKGATVDNVRQRINDALSKRPRRC